MQVAVELMMETPAVAGERALDPSLPARAGGTVGVSCVPRGAQLPSGHRLGVRRYAPEYRDLVQQVPKAMRGR